MATVCEADVLIVSLQHDVDGERQQLHVDWRSVGLWQHGASQS